MTDTKTKTLDQTLHDFDEAGKIYEFFETVLKSAPQQADIASRTMRHKFHWSGVRLLYNGDAGDEKVVAVDHVDRIREYLTRENFDFLLPKPGVTAEGFEDTSIPVDVLDAALNGSLTAKGKLAMLLGGNNQDAVARTELLLKTERAKRDGTVNGGVDNRHGQTQTERRANSTNPFLKLNMARNPAEKEAATTAISSLIRAVGTAKAAAIARGAGLTLTGQPLRR
jgi:hypothetical protein